MGYSFIIELKKRSCHGLQSIYSDTVRAIELEFTIFRVPTFMLKLKSFSRSGAGYTSVPDVPAGRGDRECATGRVLGLQQGCLDWETEPMLSRSVFHLTSLSLSPLLVECFEVNVISSHTSSLSFDARISVLGYSLWPYHLMQSYAIDVCET